MSTQYLHAAPTPSIQRRFLPSKLWYAFVVLVFTIGLLTSPHMTNAAYADSSRDATQGVMAWSRCYGVYHIVRPGQTLYSIAATYRTTAYRVAVCNGLSSYTVYVGQALLIPTRTR